MKYEKLKEFDLNSIKGKEEAENWKKEVLDSDKNDILKYINFLRWQQFNGDITMKYLNRIVNFLSFDEFIDIERENSGILTGEVEDLTIDAPVEFEEPLSNPITIGGKEFSVKSVLEDDFESVLIVSDRDEKLYKFGYIGVTGLQGVDMYAYELFEESQEYYKEIIDAKVGTKVNVFADIVGENQVIKTYRKIDCLIEDIDFILTKKTNKGVMSPVESGTFQVLKKEEIISAEGISEDRLANEMNKFKNEISSKLGINKNDVEEATKPVDEKDFEEEKQFTKDDFCDDFTFEHKHNFTIETPDWIDGYNELTETVLRHDGFDDLETMNEVYNMLEYKYNINWDDDTIWFVPNTKLESVLRTLVRAGATIEYNEENASMFLQRFIREEKLEKIEKTTKNFRIVKKIKTQKDIAEFVKDAGTELYAQIGQFTTAILEGASRLYGEGHIVFDSDKKIIICEVDDEIDLYGASNFAIDNNYDNFYVIEKDKYTQYDAWYKEKMKFDVDGNVVEEEAVEETKDISEEKEFMKEIDLENYRTITFKELVELEDDGRLDEVVSVCYKNRGADLMYSTKGVENMKFDVDDYDKVSNISFSDGENNVIISANHYPSENFYRVKFGGLYFSLMVEKEKYNPEDDAIIMDVEKTQDIVIMGTLFGEGSDFGITDDESGFCIGINGKIVKNLSCDGFGSVVPATEFFQNLDKVGGSYQDLLTAENIDDDYCIQDIFIVKNYKGEIKLRAKIEDVGYVSTANLTDEYLWHDPSLRKYGNLAIDIVVDLNENGTNITKLTSENFDKLKTEVLRKTKLERVVNDKDEENEN